MVLASQILAAETKLITEEVEAQMPEYFYPSLFQERLNKKYEIRSFYMHGEFHSTAIFSQLDQQTAVDFRNYNHECPNRNPPVLMPPSVRQNLRKLMDELDMNCGSIDLVVTTDNRYVFLEVNPVGQFAQVSIPGNFFLEKKIAKFLRND